MFNKHHPENSDSEEIRPDPVETFNVDEGMIEEAPLNDLSSDDSEDLPTTDPFGKSETKDKKVSTKTKVLLTVLGASVIALGSVSGYLIHNQKVATANAEATVLQQIDQAQQAEAPLGDSSTWTNVDGETKTGTPVPVDESVDILSKVKADLTNRYTYVGEIQILGEPNENGVYTAGFGDTTFQFQYVDGELYDNYYTTSYGNDALTEDYNLFSSVQAMVRPQWNTFDLRNDVTSLNMIDTQYYIPADIVAVGQAPYQDEDITGMIQTFLNNHDSFSQEWRLYYWHVSTETLTSTPGWAGFTPDMVSKYTNLWGNAQVFVIHTDGSYSQEQ